MAEDYAGGRRSRLFTVRIWSEGGASEPERRGSVHDVASGAFRSFRQWSDLTAFLAERVDGPPDQPTSLEEKR